MQLHTIDWVILTTFFLISLLIGIFTSKKAGSSKDEFFLSGRNMPWWLLGVSMVATTFAADTPGLVAQLVRENGVMGNWVWWAMLLTGTVTVIFYARLWRKSGVTTDLEFYEMRYSGKSAAFLRGFRALYLGVVFNVITMAAVCLAAAKISAVLLGFSQFETLIITSTIVVLYSMLGGLRGVLITDFIQFIIAMIGSVWATYYIINMPEIGGLDNLVNHPNLIGKLDILPSLEQLKNPEILIPLFLIPFAVQWWSTWYPGAEPGGGGYIAQRMLAAKSERHATMATLFFNFAHYALRPWPWILVGLASLILYPTLESIQTVYPDLDKSIIGNDLGYSVMINFLPAGLIGIVLTSLAAAFMSTISTQLNWGSSYIVNDFYVRFIKPSATQKQMVWMGRISTIVLMILAAFLSFFLTNAKAFFDLMLLIGAGTGLLFLLRWFWHRINPYSEITAMAVSFIIAVALFICNENIEGFSTSFPWHWQLISSVLLTTLSWIIVSLLTNPQSEEVLNSFEQKIFNTSGDKIETSTTAQHDYTSNKFENFGIKIIGFFLTIFAIYSALVGTGYYLLGETSAFTISIVVFLISFVLLVVKRKKIFGI
jgi:solute:Na+ symporter, SSS family